MQPNEEKPTEEVLTPDDLSVSPPSRIDEVSETASQISKSLVTTSTPPVDPSKIYPSIQQPLPQGGETSPLVPDKPHKARNGIITLVVLIVLVVGGYYAYNAFFDNTSRNGAQNASGQSGGIDQDKLAEIEEQKTAPIITESDLITVTEANSYFSRPKTWEKADGNDTFVKYQATEADPNGYRSTVGVSYYPAPQGQTLQGASEANLTTIREANIKQYSPTSLAQSFTEAGMRCGTEPTLTVTPDTAQNGTTIGILYLESVCSLGDDAILKAHAVYDRDGSRRIIMIFTSKSSLDKNAAVYDKMLASIKKP